MPKTIRQVRAVNKSTGKAVIIRMKKETHDKKRERGNGYA